MRKNLHYKVLASVLAIAGLYFYNAPAAWADMQEVGNNFWVGNGTITKNIEQESKKEIPQDASVFGERNNDSNKEANDNNVTINDSELFTVFGGYSDNAESSGNTVTIENNSTVNSVIGGRSTNVNADNNKVYLINSTVTQSVYGGNTDSGTANHNEIIIRGNSNIANAYLYGGSANSTDNKLTLDGWQNNTVASLNNFSDIYINNFTLNTQNTNTNLINVTGGVSGMDNVTIHLGAFTGDIALAAGDYAVGYNVKAAEIKWDSKLGSNVDFTIKDEDDKPIEAFAESLKNQTINNTFYIADRTDGDGVYATKFDNESGYSASHEKDANYVSITAKVKKSVLSGKFIDENRQEHTNGDGLTISEGFKTNVGTVAGVYAASGNNATDGKLIISGNTDYDKDLYGAYAENGNAENSTVEISGNTDYSGTVYAGYSESGAVNGNKINVAANTKAQNMNISGYNTTGSGNELNISGNGSEFNTISNFETINFNDVALNKTAALTVNNAYVDGTTINVNSLAGGNNYHGGESVTLLKSANAITGEGKVNIDTDIVTAGLTQDLHISTAQSADNTSIDLYVEDVSLNDQITLVAENRAVAAAFVNQGTDLISDSLDTLSHDANYGVKTFAAVHGNRSKYDVNSDLKINGWSTIVGVGNAAEFADGDEFSWGVFYENGSGNYRTFNEFNNEFFRGDGSLVYNGGGIAARYENASGVYTEGSLRAGMLKSEMDNALHDGSGNYYGYDSESAYYGAHIGVGKIISLSDSSDLDVYGKFFHTYTEGDSFTVAKDKFEFDSITSDRLRIGARVTTNKENAFSTYYGLAYEYEFNGDADMRAQNLKAPTQSLQGSSYMAEVGFNYQPAPDSPWSFDLNMRGYAGEREGASFNVQATYTF